MNEELKKQLIEIAKQRCPYDDEDFNAYDYCGGNYDDAWSGGVECGQIIFARQLLNEAKIEYTINKE